MNQEIWRAIVECDSAYDGQIYYGLITTGIFCRPSCKSKTPKIDNVKIFHTPQEARNAGLRPCKRCRPEELFWRSFDEELAQKLTQLISDSYHEPLTLQDMADKMFISPYYLQRCFKRVMNMSPAKFLLRTRLENAKSMLVESKENITAIAMKVGFQNSAHFSAVFHKHTGCSPTEYRQLVDGTVHEAAIR